MEHSRCVVPTAPQLAVAVSAVHARPTFNAAIWAETSLTIRLSYVIDLDYTAFWISKPEVKGIKKYQS